MSISQILSQLQTLEQEIQSAQIEVVDFAEIARLKQILPAMLTYLESQDPNVQCFYDVLWPTSVGKKIRASQPMQEKSIKAKYLAVLGFAKAFFSGINEIDQELVNQVMTPEGDIEERFGQLESAQRKFGKATYPEFPNFESIERFQLKRSELEKMISHYYPKWVKERDPHAHGLITRTTRGVMGMFPQFILSDTEEKGHFGGVYIFSSESSLKKVAPFVKLLPSFDEGRDYLLQFFDKYLAEDQDEIQFEHLKHHHLHNSCFQRILYYLSEVEFPNNEPGKACRSFVEKLTAHLRNHSIFLTNRCHEHFPEEVLKEGGFPGLRSPMKRKMRKQERIYDQKVNPQRPARIRMQSLPKVEPDFEENLMRAITAEISPLLNTWLDELAQKHSELKVENRDNLIAVVQTLEEAVCEPPPLYAHRQRLLDALTALHITEIPDLRNSTDPQILEWLKQNMPRPEGFYKAIYDAACELTPNDRKLSQLDFGEKEGFTSFSRFVRALEILGGK